MPAGIQTSWRDGEDLIDYEPEEPAVFSPIEDDILVPGDHTPTLEEGTAHISPLAVYLPAFSAEDGHMAGRKRLRSFLAPPTRQVLLKS